MPKSSKRRIERDIEAVLSGEALPGAPTEALPPRSMVTKLHVEGAASSAYRICPVALRLVRDNHGEVMHAKIAKRTEDDAWAIVSPNGTVIAVMLNEGASWAIYRRSGDKTWHEHQEAELNYSRKRVGDWRSVVAQVVRLEP